MRRGTRSGTAPSNGATFASSATSCSSSQHLRPVLCSQVRPTFAGLSGREKNETAAGLSHRRQASDEAPYRGETGMNVGERSSEKSAISIVVTATRPPLTMLTPSVWRCERGVTELPPSRQDEGRGD